MIKIQPYILSCCSTADLTQNHFDARNINYICFHFSLDEKSYPDDLGKSIPFEKFYAAMKNGSETKTSQINSDEFVSYFEPFLQKGCDILHVCLSSGISGVFNSANLAKKELEEKFPQRKIYVIDSLCASSGFGLFMDKLADLRDSGFDIEKLNDWAENNKLRLNHWFFSSDLSFYIKGGRISKISGWFGTVLKICPLLNMNKEGKLIPRYKIRGKKKAIEQIAEQMEKYAQNGLDYNEKCYISNSDCYEDAKAVADIIEARFKKLDGPVKIYSIGTTIGSHTGPGTVALFFWGDERNEL